MSDKKTGQPGWKHWHLKSRYLLMLLAAIAIIVWVQASPGLGRTVALGSDMTRRATTDVNQPLPALGEGTALRLNAMVQDGNVADRGIVIWAPAVGGNCHCAGVATVGPSAR